MLGKRVSDFSLAATGGTQFTLSARRGTKRVPYFHPKDNTPGCSADVRQPVAGYFKQENAVPCELLSDADQALCKQVAVMKHEPMYGKKVRSIARSTLVLDEKGVLARERRGVKIPNHPQEVSNFVKAL